MRSGVIKHGHCIGGNSPMYRAWAMMLNRCNNPRVARYADYGGRGVRVCARWHDFGNFLADMGERPPGLTLDRIDNDGDYEPGNCRWATASLQARNKRNRKLTALDVVLLRQMWIRSRQGLKGGIAAAFGVSVAVGRSVAKRISGAKALDDLACEVANV